MEKKDHNLDDLPSQKNKKKKLSKKPHLSINIEQIEEDLNIMRKKNQEIQRKIDNNQAK